LASRKTGNTSKKGGLRGFFRGRTISLPTAAREEGRNFLHLGKKVRGTFGGKRGRAFLPALARERRRYFRSAEKRGGDEDKRERTGVLKKCATSFSNVERNLRRGKRESRRCREKTRARIKKVSLLVFQFRP